MSDVSGIPVTEETQEYQGRTAGADISPQIIDHLVENSGSGFSESMLAEVLGYVGEDGRPQQQRINAPMRKLWERVQETGEQPEGVPEGYALRCFQQNDGSRLVKTWAVVQTE